MQNFDIAKYLREHQLGSYGILNHYVDLKPLKEEAEDYKITVRQINPITFVVQVDWKYGASTVTAKTAEEAAEIKDRLEQAFAAGKIQFPVQIAQYAEKDGLAEEETEVELNTEIPYEGPEHKLTGNGEGDEFEQAETVSEQIPGDDTRIMDLGGNMIEQGIIRLMDDGFEAEDILELCQMLVNDQYGAKAQGTPY